MTNLPSHAHCSQKLLSYSERLQWIREIDTQYHLNKAWPSNLQYGSLSWTCHATIYWQTQTKNRFHHYHGDCLTSRFHHSRQLQVLRSTKKHQPKLKRMTVSWKSTTSLRSYKWLWTQDIILMPGRGARVVAFLVFSVCNCKVTE